MQSTASPGRRTPRRRISRIAASALLLPLLPVAAGAFLQQSRAGADGERVFYEVLSRIATSSVDTVSEADLYEKAARGLLASIGDPYAALFSPEELAEFSRQGLRNSYGGLGMQIQAVRDTAVVMRVFPGSPAAAGAVQAGDRIVAVDGQPVTGMPLSDVTARLLGTPGSTVKVEYARPGSGPIRLDFARARVRYPSVPFTTVLEGGVGYLPLQGFNDTSAEDVEAALRALTAQGAKSLVLDLRGNTGGSLEQAIWIADLFMRRGQQILRVEYRNEAPEIVTARQNPLVGDAPLVVLTNAGSASASEIVAGALQDHDRAVVLGTPTHGKGVVQQIFRLDGGWALKLTTGQWYTPSGRTIQRPRRQLPDGRWTEVAPDSVEGPRPVYRSTGGRVVYGGGGITPDLTVRSDTLVDAERALMVALGPYGAQLGAALTETALDLSREVQAGFAPAASWREPLFRALAAKQVPVDRAVFDAGYGVLERALERRIADLAHGEAAAFHRGVAHDAQLLSALRLLNGALRQNEVFGRVAVATP
jgi:carboxyl-terminal processing protease